MVDQRLRPLFLEGEDVPEFVFLTSVGLEYGVEAALLGFDLFVSDVGGRCN